MTEARRHMSGWTLGSSVGSGTDPCRDVARLFPVIPNCDPMRLERRGGGVTGE